MAKLTSRSELTVPSGSDILHIVDDPGGTPESKKITLDNLLANVKPRSLTADDLSDNVSPHVLTTDETMDTVISNYSSSGADREFELPTAHINGSVTFVIGDEFWVSITPPTGTAFYLNGTELSVDVSIINSFSTVGDTITFDAVNINGTLRWLARTTNSNWTTNAI